MAAAEISDNESEVDGQVDNEGSFNIYGPPTQFSLNGVNEMTPRMQARILVDKEDRGKPKLPEELLKSHH